jgi:4a-hydroxytetrahydrobiopterin dehydratase
MAAKKFMDLHSWKVNSAGKLEREFVFGTFREAFSFMTRVAFEAEEKNHHPDWSNSFNRVKIELFNHAKGEISDVDIELARRIDKINWSKS